MESISLDQQAINLIKSSKRILILPSSPPDGDSIGSALALYSSLKKIDKIPTVVCHDPIPNSYNFLPAEKEIRQNLSLNRDFVVTLDCSKSEVDHIRYQVEHNKVNIIITPKKGNFTDKQVKFQHGPTKYDLIIVVDTGDLGQLGPVYEDNPELFYEIPVINIDHHASNDGFGKINIIDITASSTTEILYKLLLQLDEKKNVIDEDIATSLLAGIITDTGSFQNANTTPNSLEIASELVNLGARQQEIIKHVYKTKNLTTLKLWGKVLSRIQYSQKYRIVWSTINQQDFIETGTAPSDTGSIIDDLMTNTPGAEVVLLLKERKDGILSGSLRTTSPSISADKIAAIFEGGGHTQAAGFKMEIKDFSKAVKMIIKKIKKFQAERLNIFDEVDPEPVVKDKDQMTDNQRDKWYQEVGHKVSKPREAHNEPSQEKQPEQASNNKKNDNNKRRVDNKRKNKKFPKKEQFKSFQNQKNIPKENINKKRDIAKSPQVKEEKGRDKSIEGVSTKQEKSIDPIELMAKEFSKKEKKEDQTQEKTPNYGLPAVHKEIQKNKEIKKADLGQKLKSPESPGQTAKQTSQTSALPIEKKDENFSSPAESQINQNLTTDEVQDYVNPFDQNQKPSVTVNKPIENQAPIQEQYNQIPPTFPQYPDQFNPQIGQSPANQPTINEQPNQNITPELSSQSASQDFTARLDQAPVAQDQAVSQTPQAPVAQDQIVDQMPQKPAPQNPQVNQAIPQNNQSQSVPIQNADNQNTKQSDDQSIDDIFNDILP